MQVRRKYNKIFKSLNIFKKQNFISSKVIILNGINAISDQKRKERILIANRHAQKKCQRIKLYRQKT